MERALVIFESMFGNTRTIAEAVADGLSSRFVTDLSEVSLAPTRIPEDVSLVVVGGPTHAFGLTRPRTRGCSEPGRRPLVSPAGGLREWLEAVEPPPSGLGRRGVRHAHRQASGTGFRGTGSRETSASSRVPSGRPRGELLREGHEGPLMPGEVERARPGQSSGRRPATGRASARDRLKETVPSPRSPGSWCVERGRRRPPRAGPPRAWRGCWRRSS